MTIRTQHRCPALWLRLRSSIYDNSSAQHRLSLTLTHYNWSFVNPAVTQTWENTSSPSELLIDWIVSDRKLWNLHQSTRSRNIYSESTIQRWGSSCTDVCYPYGCKLPSWTCATAPGELPGKWRHPPEFILSSTTNRLLKEQRRSLYPFILFSLRTLLLLIISF